MCTVVLLLDAHPEAPLIVAANRDEWRARATAPFGELLPGIFGGKDLAAGGTWFAVRKDGGMALLTNVRPGMARDDSKRSRGEIVLDVLQQASATAMRARMQALDPVRYNPFNLLFGHAGEWFYASSGRPDIARVKAGVHVLGNRTLDDPDDAKTVAVAGVAPHLLRVPLAEARASLVKLLNGPLYVDAGAYGTRWSMLYAGPHAPIAAVEISESSVRTSPLAPAPLR